MTLAWLSLGVLVVGVLLEGWRPLALRFTCLQLYLSGLIAIALIVHGLQLSIPYWYLAATLVLAGYVLLIVVLTRLTYEYPFLGSIMRLPNELAPGGNWFWDAQLISMG